jgi:IclR family pca regulon transcriptional regulator
MTSERPVIPREPRYSSSIQHGLAMMQCFTAEHQLRGIADLAEELGLNRSTTHRYAVTLVALGYLEQTASRKYFLAAHAGAAGMAVLGEIAQRTHCEPVLRELREQTRHTASLAVLDGTRATYVRRLAAHLKGQYQADMDLRAGAHVPLHCTALGKALLAGLPDQDARALIDRLDLSRHGPNSIRSKRALVREIQRVRDDGAAFGDEEHSSGVRSVAVAIEDASASGGRQFAVDVNLPASACTVQQLRTRIAPFVQAAARAIAGHLAGDPPAGGAQASALA